MTAQVDFGDGLTWYKATRSSDSGGNCVCVSHDPRTGAVGVRDSKEGPAGRPQCYTREQWQGFLAGVRAGQFDL